MFWKNRGVQLVVDRGGIIVLVIHPSCLQALSSRTWNFIRVAQTWLSLPPFNSALPAPKIRYTSEEKGNDLRMWRWQDIEKATLWQGSCSSEIHHCVLFGGAFHSLTHSLSLTVRRCLTRSTSYWMCRMFGWARAKTGGKCVFTIILMQQLPRFIELLHRVAPWYTVHKHIQGITN